MHGVFLITLTSACTLSWACAPINMANMTTTTTESTTTSVITTVISERRKRNAEPAVVTVVTDELYDNSKNQYHLNLANKLLSDIANSQGIKYHKEDVLQKIKNQGGYFAIEYTIMTEVDCYGLRNFIVDAKKRTAHFNYATVECDDDEFLI